MVVAQLRMSLSPFLVRGNARGGPRVSGWPGRGLACAHDHLMAPRLTGRPPGGFKHTVQTSWGEPWEKGNTPKADKTNPRNHGMGRCGRRGPGRAVRGHLLDPGMPKALPSGHRARPGGGGNGEEWPGGRRRRRR